MNYKKLTVSELKNMCKKNHIKGYSYLNKDDLIKIIKKNLKKKMMKGGDGNKVNAKRINGDDIILDRKTLSQLLGYSSEHIFYSNNKHTLNDLTSIDLSNMNITEIKENTFSGLSNLETLNLSGNKITIINGSILKGLSNLKNLNLSNNEIYKIDQLSFNDLQKLETLNLSNNKITTLIKNEFYGLRKLENLNLSNNQITNINRDAFSQDHHIAKLKCLDLSNNNLIDTIKNTLISFIQSLQSRKKENNKLKLNCKL